MSHIPPTLLHRSGLLAVLVALVLTLSGCALPNDSKPRDTPADRVPFDLLQEAPQGSQEVEQATTVPVTVYFVQGETLRPMARHVIAPLQLGSVLAALAQGVTNEERAAGLSSAVTLMNGGFTAQVVDGTASVSFSSSFARLSPANQLLAVAQVSQTAMEVPGVDRVLFLLDGSPMPVMLPDRTEITRPVERGDYSVLVAP